MGGAVSMHQNSSVKKCSTIPVKKPSLSSVATEGQMTMETERARSGG